MNAFPFPLYDGTSFPPKDGFLVKCPTILKKGLGDPYQKLFTIAPPEERLFKDHLGFSVMPITLEDKYFLIIGVRVHGYIEHKTKSIIGTDFNPVFPLAAFIDTITKFRSALPSKSVKVPKERQYSESEKFINFTIHEIRQLNRDIKAQAEEMTANLHKGNLDGNFLDYRAQNIYGASSLISIRLNSYDFHVNPSTLATDKKVKIPIFKKFEKTKHCLQVESGRKKVNIKFDGQSFHSIDGYDVFELLPFVLLENAIKYSPPGENIAVSFTEAKHSLEIIVNSLGPVLSKDEKEHLFEADFRGVNAMKVSRGSGTGLYFSKMVCDLHDIEISAQSQQQEITTFNGVPYSYFTVTLEIKT